MIASSFFGVSIVAATRWRASGPRDSRSDRRMFCISSSIALRVDGGVPIGLSVLRRLDVGVPTLARVELFAATGVPGKGMARLLRVAVDVEVSGMNEGLGVRGGVSAL